MQSYARLLFGRTQGPDYSYPGVSAIILEDHVEILLAEAPALEFLS